MRRLDQLTAMYADIMGVSQEEARAAIVSTPAGREIARDNPAFLYEQPTANLTDIICEFPPEIRSRFSEDRVEAAVRALPVSATAVKAADVGQKDLLRAARRFDGAFPPGTAAERKGGEAVMMLKVVDDDGKNRVKDILDLNLDMSVEQGIDAVYTVRLNSCYVLKETFESQEEAEAQMFYLADVRNDLEDSLWRF